MLDEAITVMCPRARCELCHDSSRSGCSCSGTRVEPVFGTSRCARCLQQFHHRGPEKNHYLWRFGLAVHNLMKTILHLRSSSAPPSTPGTNRHATSRNAARAARPA